MSAIADEYKEWLTKKRITGVPTQENIDEFLEERNLPEKVKQDRQRWLSKHPRFQDTEKNWKLMNYWLDISNLPALYDNLDEAFAALLPTGNIALHPPPVPLPDPNKPEMRAGWWSNGRFTPFDTTAGGSGVAKDYPTGQIDPSKAASEEKQVSKSVRAQSSAEYLRNLNESPSFRKKMDGR
jgi:hypothetical protein